MMNATLSGLTVGAAAAALLLSVHGCTQNSRTEDRLTARYDALTEQMDLRYRSVQDRISAIVDRGD